MADFRYRVTVTTAYRHQADRVMSERILFDENYGFDYGIKFNDGPDTAPLVHALAVAEHRASQVGEDGFPLFGTVERGYFLIEAVREFLKNS